MKKRCIFHRIIDEQTEYFLCLACILYVYGRKNTTFDFFLNLFEKLLEGFFFGIFKHLNSNKNNSHNTRITLMFSIYYIVYGRKYVNFDVF